MTSCSITVRGYHVDVFGHVNNARYLEFLEEARWQIFDKFIQELRQKGHSLAIVNININYRRPAFLGYVLKIDGVVSSLTRRSFVITQQVYWPEGDVCIADAQVTCVFVDGQTGKALPLESEYLGWLESYGGKLSE